MDTVHVLLLLFFSLSSKNYVLCYPSVDPLIIVKQVILKLLSKLEKGGGGSMQNTLLYGNESTM